LQEFWQQQLVTQVLLSERQVPELSQPGGPLLSAQWPQEQATQPQRDAMLRFLAVRSGPPVKRVPPQGAPEDVAPLFCVLLL
jgi:hypothetical protein